MQRLEHLAYLKFAAQKLKSKILNVKNDGERMYSIVLDWKDEKKKLNAKCAVYFKDYTSTVFLL